VPFFGERPIDKIDAAQVAQYLKRKRNDGLSSKTVQNHLNFLHGVFAFAIKRGWTQSNPVAYVDRPKKNRSPHQRVRFLQPPELDKLIGAVPEDTLGGVEGALYLAAALTGPRQGELLALKWLDIDWQVARVRVADNFTRGQMGTPKVPRGRLSPDGSTARPRARRPAPTLLLPRRQGSRLLPPRHGTRPRAFQDAQALQGRPR
jgi:site-specific recombinase XerC